MVIKSKSLLSISTVQLFVDRQDLSVPLEGAGNGVEDHAEKAFGFLCP